MARSVLHVNTIEQHCTMMTYPSIDPAFSGTVSPWKQMFSGTDGVNWRFQLYNSPDERYRTFMDQSLDSSSWDTISPSGRWRLKFPE
jgi:hypothetical protein